MKRKNMEFDYFSHANRTRVRFFPATTTATTTTTTTASTTTSACSTPELLILCNFRFFVLFHLVCVPSK